MRKIFLTVLALLCVAPVFAGGKYRTDRDIPYREEFVRCKLDVSYVKKASDRPVIVWFHGGGLTGGAKHTPEALLAQDYVVVAAGYRLYPEAQVADIIDDAAAAVAWVAKNISRYGGSPSRIYLAGHSAGVESMSLSMYLASALHISGYSKSRSFMTSHI